MKKYITASLFLFWAITVAIITAGLISYGKNNQPVVGSNISGTTNQVKNVVSGKNSNTATSSGLKLTMTELAKHNSAQSCWLLISGKVYDVTSFLGQHPGGANTILSSCGTDATVAFNTKDGRGRPHSSTANTMLADYYIGDLNQAVTTNPANPTTPPIANPNPTTRSRSRNDD